MEKESRNVMSSSVPAFLVKLWRLVEDPSVDYLICWSKNGTTFCVHDPVILSRDVLPLYFKHNNFTSFVRQLNMYGFKKVITSEHGGIKPDKDEWEFHHPNFAKGRADLLDYVKRKVHPEDKKMKSEEFSVIVEDVKELQTKHSVVQNRLESLKMENEDLWREVADLRMKHKKQQHVLNKLIKFLILVYGGKGSAPETVSSRKRLAIEVGQSTSKRMRSGQFSEAEEPENLQYTVESPVRTEELFPMDIEESTRGPQIVVLPDEPKAPKVQTISSVSPERVLPSSKTDLGNKSQKARAGQSKNPSAKPKNDALTLQMPSMVSISSQREKATDFSPSLFEGLGSLFPVGPFATTGDTLQELQRTLPSSDFRSALVPARSNSSVDKDEIDFDVDQINGSLDSLQSMLSGPQFDIDSNTLHQLFEPDDNRQDLNAALNVDEPLNRLQAASENLIKADPTGIEGNTDCENIAPFSPGMFLNDVGESSVDEADKGNLKNEASIL